MSLHFDNAQQRLVVSGEMTLESVQQKMDASETLFSEAHQLTIDLGGVTLSDSAGLALLVHWMRKAKQQGKPIHFANMPPQMLEMARASGLEDLFSLQTN